MCIRDRVPAEPEEDKPAKKSWGFSGKKQEEPVPAEPKDKTENKPAPAESPRTASAQDVDEISRQRIGVVPEPLAQKQPGINPIKFEVGELKHRVDDLEQVISGQNAELEKLMQKLNKASRKQRSTPYAAK
eukprot:TRINITY_DN39326_c0_g1_i2.p2 TRINITY_DN39326_c0_g1~~TRINITY_DN39326_c0_g1_i2.p2  ORF type:complete len:131 (-),score=29.97 TRINITY_DN39326_c0_g1_i2:10-402(-)